MGRQEAFNLVAMPRSMLMSLLLVFLMLDVAHGGVGIIACVSCATALCPAVIAACAPTAATPVAPLALAACIVMGCAGPCGVPCGLGGSLAALTACFDNGTMIDTPSGKRPIADVRKGDLVLTDSGYTEVVENDYVSGETAMVTMQLERPKASLTVTANHWMFVGGTVVQAADVAVGAKLPRRLGTADQMVAAVTHSVLPGKWALSTGACSVYADGILTGTLCSNRSSQLWSQLELKQGKVPILA